MIKKVMLILGSLSFLNAAALLFLSNFSVGILLQAIVSVAIISYAFFLDKIKKSWHIAIVIICLIPLILMTSLAVYGNCDNVQYDETVAIVLGAGIHGEEVGENLAKRLDKAAEYHAENKDAIIVVCGGKGNQEEITEALAMERYLVKKGIPKNKIVKEEQSTSTYENFLFAKEILDTRFPNGFSSVIITNDYHIYRAVKTAKCIGIPARHIGADTQWYTVASNYLRETLAVVKMWVGIN